MFVLSNLFKLVLFQNVKILDGFKNNWAAKIQNNFINYLIFLLSSNRKYLTPNGTVCHTVFHNGRLRFPQLCWKPYRKRLLVETFLKHTVVYKLSALLFL